MKIPFAFFLLIVAIFLLVAASKFPSFEGVSLDGVILEGVLDGVGGMFSLEFLKGK